MNKETILNLFYGDIVPGASKGRVECFFTMNLAFETIIQNQKVSEYHISIPGLVVPILKITNQERFNQLLCEYVELASTFYSESNFDFLNDMDKSEFPNLEEAREQVKIKYIICTLLANASYSDLLNPVTFLEERISAIQNVHVDNEYQFYGHFDSIQASLHLKEEKSSILAETPTHYASYLLFDDGYTMPLPDLYAMKGKETYNLYGIQDTSNTHIEDEYMRRLRKGFHSKINGAPNHYFVVAMLYLALSENQNYTLKPFLPLRWNAKRIGIEKDRVRKGDEVTEELLDKQEHIQTNITDIGIRYFTKIRDCSEGMVIDSVPFELDDSLHFHLEDDFQSKAPLVGEMFACRVSSILEKHL